MAGTIFARETRHNIYKVHMDDEDYQAMLKLPTLKTADPKKLKLYFQGAFSLAGRWMVFHLHQDFRKLNSYKKKNQAMNKICNTLLPEDYDGHIYIGFGDYSSNQSTIKGHIRRPILGLRRKLEKCKRRQQGSLTVMTIDEYKTSKTCSFCLGPVSCQRRVGKSEKRDNMIYGAVRC